MHVLRVLETGADSQAACVTAAPALTHVPSVFVQRHAGTPCRADFVAGLSAPELPSADHCCQMHVQPHQLQTLQLEHGHVQECCCNSSLPGFTRTIPLTVLHRSVAGQIAMFRTAILLQSPALNGMLCSRNSCACLPFSICYSGLVLSLVYSSPHVIACDYSHEGSPAKKTASSRWQHLKEASSSA